MNFESYNKSIYTYLNNMIVTNQSGEVVKIEDGFHKWIVDTFEIAREGKKIFLIGNGASSMMAGHMAADAAKNGLLKALAFNDAAIMTALSNDISYESVFSFQLNRFADEGDMLVTISSSGNSPNILAAIEKAKELSMNIITISGLKSNNKSRELGDLNFYVPAQTYGEVECAHQIILHYWLDKYMEEAGLEI